MIQSLISIHPDAKIASNVIIESFSTIHKNVEIGEGTWIGSNVTIMEGARIGKNCKIFSGAVISAVPQDLKFRGEETITIIGDNTVIREFVTVNRGTVEKYETVVGSNCLLMAYSHIAHDCIIGNNCVIGSRSLLAGHVKVNDFVTLGDASAIAQFVNIGKYVLIGGGSLVRKDVPPFTKAAGSPLSYVGINYETLEKEGFSTEKTNEIQKIYNYIYLNKMNVHMALDYLNSHVSSSSERDDIVNFINKSEKGIIRL